MRGLLWRPASKEAQGELLNSGRALVARGGRLECGGRLAAGGHRFFAGVKAGYYSPSFIETEPAHLCGIGATAAR